MKRTIFFSLLGAGGLYLVGTVALVYAVVHRGAEEFAPLDYASPQRVINPVVRPGEKLIVEAYKCNRADHPISVQAIDGAPIIRNLDTQELIPRPGVRLDAYVREPGCPLLHFENPLPDLAPGRYRLEGVEVATEGEKVQREAWSTQEFCVTDANGEGC